MYDLVLLACNLDEKWKDVQKRKDLVSGDWIKAFCTLFHWEFSVGHRGDIIPKKKHYVRYLALKKLKKKDTSQLWSSCCTRLGFGLRQCFPLSYRCIHAGSQNPFFHSWWANAIKHSKTKNDSKHKHNQSNKKEGGKKTIFMSGPFCLFTSFTHPRSQC